MDDFYRNILADGQHWIVLSLAASGISSSDLSRYLERENWIIITKTVNNTAVPCEILVWDFKDCHAASFFSNPTRREDQMFENYNIVCIWATDWLNNFWFRSCAKQNAESVLLPWCALCLYLLKNQSAFFSFLCFQWTYLSYKFNITQSNIKYG